MSTFAAIASKRPPPGNVIVPASAFDATWDRRPTSDVCLGLRFISDDDAQTARSQAAKTAFRLHPRAASGGLEEQPWADAYEDALMRWIVARGTCDANDAAKAWDGWLGTPEDTVSVALTIGGVRLIFDAWERMRIAHDVTIPEATDEEIAQFAAIAPERLGQIGKAEASRVRRLVRFCLNELESEE